MCTPTVVKVPSTSNIMEILKRQDTERVIKYPTATYSVQTGRISFAPGTNFNRKLPSRVSERTQTSSMNIQPVQEGEGQRIRFIPPRATATSLPHQSVTGMDYIDPRSALEYAKWSEVPPWFCRSKSDVLVSDSHADRCPTVGKTTENATTSLYDVNDDMFSNDGTENTSQYSSYISPSVYLRRTPSSIVRSRGRSRDTLRSNISTYSLTSKPGSGKQNYRPMVPHYKPLIGEVYSIRRLQPAHNPWRTLQLENEVTQYVEHKKKCQGRNVRFTDTVDVTANQPHNRPTLKKLSFDDRAKHMRYATDVVPNLSIGEVCEQQKRLQEKQAKLKDMLK